MRPSWRFPARACATSLPPKKRKRWSRSSAIPSSSPRTAKDPNVFFNAGGTEKVGDIDARIVDVNAAGAAIRWFVDPQSGHILKETYRTLSQGGPVPGETDMDNWKPISGLNLPLVRHNKQNGKDSSTAEYTALEINPAIDPKLFDKPAEKPANQP